MDDLLQQGIAVLKAGDRVWARQLLIRAVQADPQSEQAWLWLSGAVESDKERLACMGKVLAINPNNEAARRGAAMLQQQQNSQPTKIKLSKVGAQPKPVGPPAAVPTPTLESMTGQRERRSVEAQAEASLATFPQPRPGRDRAKLPPYVWGILAASGVVTCLVVMALVVTVWSGGEPAVESLPFLAPTSTPTPRPSPTPDVVEEIKRYLEETAPLVEESVDAWDAFSVLFELASRPDMDVVSSPQWRAEMRTAIRALLDAEERLLQVEPPEPLRSYHREQSLARDHLEKSCDYYFAYMDDRYNFALLDMGMSEAELVSAHAKEATKLMNQVLAAYGLEDYQW